MHYEKFADGTVKCIEEEIPFELPEGWEWERLGNISNIARGGSPRPIESYITDDKSGINWIKIGDTEKDGKYIYTTKEKIKKEGLSKSRYVESDDFLLTNSMSFGRPYILKTNGCIHDGWLVIGNIKNVFNQDYLYYALSSNFMYQTLSLLAAGSTVKNLKSDTVKSVLFPIPPMKEQQEIANAVNRFMEYVVSIEKDKTTLLETIQSTKSKILDLAIRGKLVPQDSNDEPASVLLERIRAEKEELIKLGKIKRDKKGSVIFKGDDNSYYEKYHDGKLHCLDNELPFELPEGWEWCRGINCFSKMQSKKPTGELFKYIDIDSIDNNKQQLNKAKIISVNNAPSRASRVVFSGSVLFSLVRPYLKNIALIDEGNADCIASTGFYICTSNGLLNSQFLYFLMISPYVVDGLNQFMKGDNSPSISKDDVEKWLYPIPPIEEQKAIASKIAALFSYLDSIAELLD